MNKVLRFSFAFASAMLLVAGLLSSSTLAASPSHSEIAATDAAASSAAAQTRPSSQKGLASSVAAASEGKPTSVASVSTRKAPASALNRSILTAKNPYGDIMDKRGLWPYKPGQKYDRTNERSGGGFLGGLFGG